MYRVFLCGLSQYCNQAMLPAMQAVVLCGASSSLGCAVGLAYICHTLACERSSAMTWPLSPISCAIIVVLPPEVHSDAYTHMAFLESSMRIPGALR
jgi:hypothetical protein